MEDDKLNSSIKNMEGLGFFLFQNHSMYPIGRCVGSLVVHCMEISVQKGHRRYSILVVIILSGS